VNSGEYKVMGLAPYGEPKYSGLILNEMIDLKEDGSFRMNMDYFSHDSGASVITDKFEQLLGRSRRKPETLLAQDDMDIARSVQDVTEEIMMRMAVHIRKETGEKNLCLAGGVALNCVANGKLLRKKVFEDIWIQPAAGDAGCAAGAALYYWHKVAGGARKAGGQEPAHGSYLGPQYDPDDIEAMLKARGIPYERMADVEERVSSLLAEGKIVGWCTGRMEFGPRALGSRSILGDARVRDMQQKMNLKIKFRESFRPFAPAVLEEKASEWFDLDRPSPYMLLVTQVKADKQRQMTGEEQKLFGLEKLNVVRSQIPAVTHVDYSARVQTVSRMTNPKFHRLLSKFNQKTGCPVLINTSFNVRGEPIVCTPEDAYRCFMRTDIDYLVIEDCLIDKRKQPEWAEDEDWRQKYQLD
jgi:carbamoyltransferase